IAENYETLLKPMEFNGSHVSQIVTGKGWEEKLEWIAENYETLLKPMEFNGSHVSQIVRNKGWEEKLEWIAENYVFFKENGLSNYKLSSSFNTKEWQFKTQTWFKNKDLFDLISFDDERISPLVEGYIRNLIFEGADRALVSSLISKCTNEEIERFENDVYSISTIQTTDSVDVVLNELNNKFGYYAEEIKMYLIAVNKNQRGLLSWYDSGEKTKLYTVSLDGTISEEDDKNLLELIPTEERSFVDVIITKNVVEEVYRNIIHLQPENKGLWQKFIFSYECDMENFTQEERTQFNSALRALKDNKASLGEIYGILKS
ncbi:MAG: hypothetical protein O2871_03410, partial [bacterium]|nr:hypothetical protein [bacterium]